MLDGAVPSGLEWSAEFLRDQSWDHCFLLYMNDLPAWIKNNIKMFADDTKIWSKILSDTDGCLLQEDLDNIERYGVRSGYWSYIQKSGKLCMLDTAIRQHIRLKTAEVQNFATNRGRERSHSVSTQPPSKVKYTVQQSCQQSSVGLVNGKQGFQRTGQGRLPGCLQVIH